MGWVGLKWRERERERVLSYSAPTDLLFSFLFFCRKGGHLELQAISQALDVAIEVYSADQPVVKIGEDKEGAPLRLAYHLHAYGLGEHYNSVRPISTSS